MSSRLQTNKLWCRRAWNSNPNWTQWFSFSLDCRGRPSSLGNGRALAATVLGISASAVLCIWRGLEEDLTYQNPISVESEKYKIPPQVSLCYAMNEGLQKINNNACLPWFPVWVWDVDLIDRKVEEVMWYHWYRDRKPVDEISPGPPIWLVSSWHPQSKPLIGQVCQKQASDWPLRLIHITFQSLMENLSPSACLLPLYSLPRDIRLAPRHWENEKKYLIKNLIYLLQ